MAKKNPFKYFNTSPEIIRLAVTLYVRFSLSIRNAEGLLHERGINVSHESVRFRRNSFGPIFAGEIRRKQVSRMRAHSNWQWHPDEEFVKINGESQYLRRAVDNEGDVLESSVTAPRQRLMDRLGGLFKGVILAHHCREGVNDEAKERTLYRRC